ncbi:DUF2934 domain-containing protein [Nitrospira sp. BLG_2]|uniref:DUF2934 domain-containing protein n=1 Tax=Nitrospira sp. BLG_2 TaxID=3397507 RepID=UPI003B9CD5DA
MQTTVLPKEQKPARVPPLAKVKKRDPGSAESQTVSQAAGPSEQIALIAKRAYELYEQRGREDGHALDDWLQAERECQVC